MCVQSQSMTAFFSSQMVFLLYINLQVNMILYLLWSPWTHLKTCSPLPPMLSFSFHLISPPRPDLSSSLSQLHPFSPTAIISYQDPLSSSSLVLSHSPNHRLFATLRHLITRHYKETDRIFHKKLLTGKSPYNAM